MTTKHNVGAWSAATTGAGAAVLATAATACCVPILAPLLVSVLGVSGAIWAANLEPYSLLILLASALVLAYGFWAVYRVRPVAEGELCPTKRPLPIRTILLFSALLWSVALVVNVLRLLNVQFR